MIRKLIQIFILLVVFAWHSYAQKKVFDPLLDPQTMIVPSTQIEVWNSTYMWYPGQLAAFYQKQCADISKERCVNVGYPGKFFAISHQAYFKKEIRLNKETTIKWVSPSAVTLYVNDVKQTIPNNQITLQPGKSELMFEVKTTSSLPCIMFDDRDFGDFTTWQVSLDKSYWTIPETASLYNKPNILPDAPQDLAVLIKPTEILPMRNAALKEDKVIIGKNGYVLIDFFHLEIGKLALKAKGNGTITVRVGETPEEALERDEKRFEQYALEPFNVSEKGTFITTPERAFRYVSLECDKGAEISEIVFNTAVWPVEYQMQFESDDEYVNNLFDMSSATLHASMHRFYLDGIKRDFLPWSMDALVSTFGGDYLFGDQQVSKKGISIALMPLHPTITDMGIPDYPLHALVGLKQNYLRFGDLTTSLQYKDRILQLLDFYASIVDENGFVHGNYGSAEFGYTPGWSNYNGPARKGVAAYAQIMLYYNYEIGTYFATLWKEKSLAKKYKQLAQNLKKNIFEHFWDKDRYVFINGTMNDATTVDNRISHHAQYWAILADIFPCEHYDNLFENILPNLPNYYESISYEKGYEFLAYAKAGRIQEMWDHIYRVFGDWMDQGHTRFPENFRPNASRAAQLVFYNRPYGLSLCHGANGVPAVVGALNGLIGFSQSVNNPNEYTIQPELLHLKWINSRIPIKEGYIYVRLRADGDSTIEIPVGCTMNIVTKGSKKPMRVNKSGVYTFKI